MTADDQPMAPPSTTPRNGGPETDPVAEPVARQQQMAQTQPVPTMPTDGVPGPADANPSARDHDKGGALFADDDRAGLRSRWDALQASFVDDPKKCVQEADGLVEEVVQRLTASFAEARSRLDEQWSQGQEASTEDLRLALQRYRDFFHRLLTV